MDDVPLAFRLKKRRTEKTGEKRSSEEIKHAESNIDLSRKRAGPQSVGGKSQSYDIHMKRNKVYVYLQYLILLATIPGFRNTSGLHVDFPIVMSSYNLNA